MPVPITRGKVAFQAVPGRWICPISEGNHDGVTIRADLDAGGRILIIVQEADLPEPDPLQYPESAWMHYVSPGDNPYPLGQYADSRSKVWLRGESSGAINGLIWPVKN